MTILQGVRAFLDGSVGLGGGDGDGEEGGASAEGSEDQPAPVVEVVFKKGIRVNGANEHDRDAALSEVSSVQFSSVFGLVSVRFSFRFSFGSVQFLV